MTILIFLKFLGSLGLLIYGMKLLGESLQKMAGNQLRHIMDTLTTNRFTSFLTGAIITAIIQSSLRFFHRFPKRSVFTDLFCFRLTKTTSSSLVKHAPHAVTMHARVSRHYRALPFPNLGARCKASLVVSTTSKENRTFWFGFFLRE